MTTCERDPDDQLVYSPAPTVPELFIDLDLMLLSARDESARWSALVSGTREVLSRFDHLSDSRIFSANARTVIDSLTSCAGRFEDLGVPALALWLKAEIVAVLIAHQHLQDLCLEQIRSANDAEVVDAITEATMSLRLAAEQAASRRFAMFPDYANSGGDYQLKLAALASLGAEIRRNSLRKQLDGAGGAAGSPEFNPLVGALFDLELVTHRRVYRVLYEFARHVGVDLDGDDLFERPDIVDSQQL